MPTYDNECKKCKHVFESFQPVSAKLPKCPKCGAETKRLIVKNYGGFRI